MKTKIVCVAVRIPVIQTFTSCNNANTVHLTVMKLDHTLNKFNYQKHVN